MHLPNKWTALFMIVTSVVRFSMGAYTALFGPTLLYLANNVDVDVYEISTMFTGRSVGTLLGSILGGVLKRLTSSRFNHLLFLGLGVAILGVTDILVPWIDSFWLLILDVVIGGVMFGYLDAGLQAVILSVWGENGSRSLIQVYHLAYSIGAFVSPLMADPFLTRANADQHTLKRSCPGGSDVTTTPSQTNISTTSSPTMEFNPIGWTYIIVASMIAASALLLLMLSFVKVETKISSSSEETLAENRAEEPLRDVFVLFLIVIGYYFCSTTTENIFYNYIYSVAVCSDLRFSVSQASKLTSLFWLGFGVGRATGVVASKIIKPEGIIKFCICGTIIDMILMVAFGKNTPWIPWAISVSHGYTTAMLYPSGVSLVSQMTNISGTYMFICNIGNAAGSLSMLLLAGYLFDNVNPFSVMTLVLVVSVINAVFFVLLLVIGNNRHIRAGYERLANGEDSSVSTNCSNDEKTDDLTRRFLVIRSAIS